MTILSNALDLVKAIKKIGYDAYVVGGAVRDLLLDKTPTDIDIATNCPIGILQIHFDTHFVGNSRKYETLVIVHNKIPYETTQFRIESDYDGVNPSTVEFVRTLEEDVKRRDFTVNSMAMDHAGKIYDYEGGEIDLKNRLIKAVGDPDQRFTEDFIRMVRAARFAASDGFEIEKQTAESIRKHAHLIKKVKPERINIELTKAFKKSGKESARFIELLDELFLLHQILPEVEELKRYNHNPDHHPEGDTVFDHTIECLRIADKMDYVDKLAILLHDVGKPASAKPKEDSPYPSYHDHASIGADIAYDMLAKYRFSIDTMDAVVFAVLNHMKFHAILKMRPSKIMRLVNNPYFSVLKNVAWADEFSRGEQFAYYRDFDDKLVRIDHIQSKWQENVKNETFKLVDGTRIMNLLEISPGPLVGTIKTTIEEYIIDNSLVPNINVVDRLILDIGGDIKKGVLA